MSMSDADQHFVGLILSLQHSTWICLGKIANPSSGKIELNLVAAKDTIDLLVCLEGKTKGNLADEETKLLSGMLTELRLNYVDELKKDQLKKSESKSAEKGDADTDKASSSETTPTASDAKADQDSDVKPNEPTASGETSST